MFIKLLVGPAASGKSTYIQAHKSGDDLVAFVADNKLIFRDQKISYKLQREFFSYFALMNNADVKKLAKDKINDQRFVTLCSTYTRERDKEITLWIEPNNISQEAIEALANSWKHRFELIEFPQK